SAAGCRGTRRFLFRGFSGRRALGLVHFRLVSLLRRLEAGGGIGEVLVALLVLFGLAAGCIRALARNLGFARGALLRQLVSGAAILIRLLLRDLVFLSAALVVGDFLACRLFRCLLCFGLLTLVRLHLFLRRPGILR